MKVALSQTEEKAKGKTRKWIRVRAFSVIIVFGLLYILLYVRSYSLHFGDDSRLARLSETQYHKKIVLAPERGTIFDRNGHELAVDIEVFSIFAHPGHIPVEKRPEVAGGLAKILHASKAELLEKLTGGKRFVWIDRRISPEVRSEIEKMKFPGVYSVPEKKRYYPNGPLAGQLLGAVGYDSEALGGIELAYDSHLKSSRESYLLEQDARGRSYLYTAGGEKREFADVHLSIDRTIQYIAERELAVAMETYHPNHGFVIVAKPSTGEILAVANAPSFDPNRYGDTPVSLWRNHAFLDVYEPGSTFKSVTAAAALHSGLVGPDDQFFCENGNWIVGKRRIRDSHSHGMMSLRDIIKVSSNIGIAKVEQVLGRSLFASAVKSFGFGERSFLKFPGESVGMLQNPKTWGPVEEANIAFGQGIAVTGLQMVQAYGSFGNGGSLLKPILVKSVVDRDGKVLKQESRSVIREVLSAKESAVLSEMLEGVVGEGGTAQRAALEDFRVSGKTGTAQKVVDGAYAKGKFVSSFIGYVPAEKPELLIYAVLDEPKPQYYGGVVAAPIFREVAAQSLNHLGVMGEKPDTLLAKEEKKLEKPEMPVAREKRDLVRQEGDAPELLALAKGEVIEESLKTAAVPDLRGLSLREILPVFNRSAYILESEGVGFVASQSPSAGTLLEPGQAVHVVLGPSSKNM